MSKKSLISIMILLISVAILSLYSTFAYDEELIKLEESSAEYNLIYSLKETSSKKITIFPEEEKFIDITLTNPYESTVKYGMYYYLENPKKIDSGLIVELSEESASTTEDYIKSNQTKSVSIRIKNETNKKIEMTVGALVGFENGKIEDLIKDEEILIK